MTTTKKQTEDLIEQEHNRQDLGFGTKIVTESTRLINPDGKFNFKLKNQPLQSYINLYNRLILMSWGKFSFLIFSLFIIANLIFAIAYFLLGENHLLGVIANNSVEFFSECFFFSAQTLTTVGYGRISPIGFWTSLVAAIESLIGLLAFALATGLLYGKFSRPKSSIIYSTNALISPYFDSKGLMFRIVNERSHPLIDVSTVVIFSILEPKSEKNNELIRKYYNLDLERDKVTFFPSTWTIVHPITDKSPIAKFNKEYLLNNSAEIIIAVKGFDDSFSQTVHSRKSYAAAEIIWNAKFENVQEAKNGVTFVDLKKLSDYKMV